jgi:hypothetical protein
MKNQIQILLTLCWLAALFVLLITIEFDHRRSHRSNARKLYDDKF